MDKEQILKFLWDTGHFSNPRYGITNGLKEDELKLLNLTDTSVVCAIESLQSFDANMELLALKHHKRSAMFDGDIGPATLELMRLPRCGAPDYALKDLATGSGSWPSGCGGKEGHSIKIDVNISTMPAHYGNGVWERIKAKNKEAYGAIGLDIEYVTHGEISQVDLRWKVLVGSTIGLAEFNSRSCGDNVFQYIDPGYKAAFDYLVALHMHETGHNCNLQHTRGGIMNPSILRVPLDWTNDVSYSTLKRFFGGEPINPPDDPEEPESSVVMGLLTMYGKLIKVTGEEV